MASWRRLPVRKWMGVVKPEVAGGRVGGQMCEFWVQGGGCQWVGWVRVAVVGG